MTSEWHLSEEQLAMLVEGNAGEGDSALLREHLKMCPDCATAYEDVAHYRAIWQADASVFRTSDDLLALAEQRGAITASDNLAMLCGTLPAIGGVRAVDRYKMSLIDTDGQSLISLDYNVERLPPRASQSL